MTSIDTDLEAFKDYLAFQFCLAGKTLFRGIRELPPAHVLIVRDGRVAERRYWDVYYKLDFDHSEKYFAEQTRALDTNLSVAAISGLDGAIDGIRAVEKNLMPGKIIVYPSAKGLKLTPKGITAEGDRVAVEAESYGQHANGKVYNNQYHFLIEVRNDKIQAVREYLDTMHANEVLVG